MGQDKIIIGSFVKVMEGEYKGEVCEVIGISNSGQFIEISNSTNLRVMETLDNVLLLEDGDLECPQDESIFF